MILQNAIISGLKKKLCMTRARIRKSLFHRLFDNLFTEEVIFFMYEELSEIRQKMFELS